MPWMLALPLLAVAPSDWAASFNELTYADSQVDPACLAKFDVGSVAIVQAFDAPNSTIARVLRVRGKNLKGLRAGQRLFARGSFERPFPAIVLQADDNSATVVMPAALIETMWAEAEGNVYLFETPDRLTSLNFRILSFSSSDDYRARRERLTELISCQDELENSD